MSRFSVPEFGEKMRRLTCVSWRPDGREILASYSSDYIYIFDANSDSEERGKKLRVGNPVRKASRRRNRSPQPFKKLRLRGDWSDTGPHSRPETEARHGGGQQREERSAEAASSEREAGHQVSLMQRMTDALSRMLNDPSTRLAMQRLNSQAEGAELAAGGGTENREPRQEAGAGLGAELGARPRASQGQQSRAAVAIQDRWRRYRQRRHEVGDTPTLHQPGSSPDTMTCHSAPPSPGREQQGEEEVEEEEGEGPSQCSSQTKALFCCQAPRVEPEQEEHQVEFHCDKSRDSNVEQSSACAVTNMDNAEAGATPHTQDLTVHQLEDSSDQQLEDTSDQLEDGRDQLENSRDQQLEDSRDQLEDSRDQQLEDSRDHLEDSRDQLEDSSDQLEENDQTMEQLEDSVAGLRSRGVEAAVELRYSGRGTGAGRVTVVGAGDSALPGPSRVVTGPGNTGYDPATGVRRRRSGISSVPTSAILPDTRPRGAGAGAASGEDTVVEYETSDESFGEDEAEDELGPEGGSDRVIKQPRILRQLTGHRNARTMIKEAAWWGTRFVLSGSDCGHLFAWDRDTGSLVMMLEADRY